MEKQTNQNTVCEDINVSEALKVLFKKPTSREQYHALSLEAAILERQKNYITATQQWVAAAQVASAEVDRHWCEARAHLCERRAGLANNAK